MIKKGEKYSYPVDIWCLGVILYQLCALKHPFGVGNKDELIYKIVGRILKGKYDKIPPHYSKDMKNMINNLLTVDSNERLKTDEILLKIKRILQVDLKSLESESLGKILQSASSLN